MDMNKPIPGRYWRRFVRGGPKVPVEFTVSKQDGGPICRFLDGDGAWQLCSGIDAIEIWQYCAGHPITRDEHAFMVKDALHAIRHRENDPKAEPYTPIDHGSNSKSPISAAEMLLEDQPTTEDLDDLVFWIKRAAAVLRRLKDAREDIAKPIKAELAMGIATHTGSIDKLEGARETAMDALHEWRVQNGMQKITTDYGAQTSDRTTNSVVVMHPEMVPAEFLMPNVAAIKSALEHGHEVAGCKLVATIKTVVV